MMPAHAKHSKASKSSSSSSSSTAPAAKPADGSMRTFDESAWPVQSKAVRDLYGHFVWANWSKKKPIWPALVIPPWFASTAVQRAFAACDRERIQQEAVVLFAGDRTCYFLPLTKLLSWTAENHRHFTIARRSDRRTGGGAGVATAMTTAQREYLRRAPCGREQKRLDAALNEILSDSAMPMAQYVAHSLYAQLLDYCDYDMFSVLAEELEAHESLEQCSFSPLSQIQSFLGQVFDNKAARKKLRLQQNLISAAIEHAFTVTRVGSAATAAEASPATPSDDVSQAMAPTLCSSSAPNRPSASSAAPQSRKKRANGSKDRNTKGAPASKVKKASQASSSARPEKDSKKVKKRAQSSPIPRRRKWKTIKRNQVLLPGAKSRIERLVKKNAVDLDFTCSCADGGDCDTDCQNHQLYLECDPRTCPTLRSTRLRTAGRAASTRTSFRNSANVLALAKYQAMGSAQCTELLRKRKLPTFGDAYSLARRLAQDDAANQTFARMANSYGNGQKPEVRNSDAGSAVGSQASSSSTATSPPAAKVRDSRTKNAKVYCANCRIQTRTFAKTKVFKTQDGRGFGLMVVEDVSPGDLIAEYVGEIIDEEEHLRRLKQKLDHPEQFGTDVYFAGLGGGLFIDAERIGGPARMANHSCDPNCHLQKWTVAHHPRLVIAAAKHLPAGTEISYNYDFVFDDEGADRENSVLQAFRQECRCGAKNCSGFIGKSEQRGGRRWRELGEYSSDSSSDEANEADGAGQRKAASVSQHQPQRRSSHARKAVAVDNQSNSQNSGSHRKCSQSGHARNTRHAECVMEWCRRVTNAFCPPKTPSVPRAPPLMELLMLWRDGSRIATLMKGKKNRLLLKLTHARLVQFALLDQLVWNAFLAYSLEPTSDAGTGPSDCRVHKERNSAPSTTQLSQQSGDSKIDLLRKVWSEQRPSELMARTTLKAVEILSNAIAECFSSHGVEQAVLHAARGFWPPHAVSVFRTMLLVERDLAACCRESSLSLEQIFGQSAENASHSFAPYTLPSAKRLSRATLRATSEPQVAVGNIMAEARQIALRLQATGGSELELDSVLVPGRVVEGNYLSEGEWFSGVIDKVHPGGLFSIQYDDGDYEEHVPRDCVRLPQMPEVEYVNGHAFPASPHVELGTSASSDTYGSASNSQSQAGAASAAISSSSAAGPSVIRAAIFREGQEVAARWKGRSRWYRGVVTAVKSRGVYQVRYFDGDVDNKLNKRFIRDISEAPPETFGLTGPEETDDSATNDKKLAKINRESALEADAGPVTLVQVEKWRYQLRRQRKRKLPSGAMQSPIASRQERLIMRHWRWVQVVARLADAMLHSGVQPLRLLSSTPLDRIVLRSLIVPQTDIWSLTAFPLENSLTGSTRTKVGHLSPLTFFEHLRTTVRELETVHSLASFGVAGVPAVAVASSVNQLPTSTTETSSLPCDKRGLPSPNEFLRGVDAIRVLVARTKTCQKQRSSWNVLDTRGLDRVLEHANRLVLRDIPWVDDLKRLRKMIAQISLKDDARAEAAESNSIADLLRRVEPEMRLVDAYFRSIARVTCEVAVASKQHENDASVASPPLALVADDVTICNDSDGDDVDDSELILAFGSAEACSQTAEAAHEAEKTGESLVIQCDIPPEHSGDASSASTTLPNTRIRVFSKVAHASGHSTGSASRDTSKPEPDSSVKQSTSRRNSPAHVQSLDATAASSIAVPVVQSSTKYLHQAYPILESKLGVVALTSSQVVSIQAALSKIWQAFQVACMRALALTHQHQNLWSQSALRDAEAVLQMAKQDRWRRVGRVAQLWTAAVPLYLCLFHHTHVMPCYTSAEQTVQHFPAMSVDELVAEVDGKGPVASVARPSMQEIQIALDFVRSVSASQSTTGPLPALELHQDLTVQATAAALDDFVAILKAAPSAKLSASAAQRTDDAVAAELNRVRLCVALAPTTFLDHGCTAVQTSLTKVWPGALKGLSSIRRAIRAASGEVRDTQTKSSAGSTHGAGSRKRGTVHVKKPKKRRAVTLPTAGRSAAKKKVSRKTSTKVANRFPAPSR